MQFKEWLKYNEDGDLNTYGFELGSDGGEKLAGKYRPPKLFNNDKTDKLFGKKKKKSKKKLSESEDAGAGFVFTDGKSILLLKRSDKTKHARTWGLPAGHAEYGESPLQTADREANEEIGLGEVGEQFGQAREKDGKWLFYFHKVKNTFGCNLNDEHTAYAWVPFEELQSYPLHPLLKRRAHDYVAFIKSHFND